jgi:alkanesulfonate monooxygenase SsuD/methylene tetrahydromethanopterin reductase-like flavin-dependent oxidoreductase (luciferase family)
MPDGSGPVVGLMLPTAAAEDGAVDPARVMDTARWAEAAGFDGVYVGDHLLHPRPLLESVVTLAAVAVSTERVSLGPCVLLAALRQPVVLAKQLATLTWLAPGRLRVGVGVGGEYPAEFAAAGLPLAERGRRTEEALSQVRALLAGRPVPAGSDRDGTAPLPPIAPAAHGDVPFLLAGWRDVALRRAARCGDGWIGYLLTPEGFARRRAFLLECRAERGADPETFTTGMLLPVHPAPGIAAGSARAQAAAGWARITANGAAFPGRVFAAGPPDLIVERLHAYWDVGCRELVLAVVDQGPGYRDALEVLAEAVLPRLQAFRSA